MAEKDDPNSRLKSPKPVDNLLAPLLYEEDVVRVVPEKPAPSREISMEEVNAHPLNQEAKRWLRLAEVPVEENCQHLIQLMLWGLAKGKVSFAKPHLQTFIQEQVDGMYSIKEQNRLLEYLQENPEGDHEEPLLDVEVLKRSWTPKQAALYVLQALNERLLQDPHLEGSYPREYPFSPG